MIKASVVIPIYKVPTHFLRECLNSLTTQTMRECEFIVVSDGAPDEENQICEEYTPKDSRFKFFKKKHVGVSTARNFGIKQAQGEYITFLDSDDILLPDALNICYQKAKQWNSDILTFNYASLSQQGMQVVLPPWQNTSLSIINSSQKDSVLKEFIYKKQNSIPRGICGKLYRKKFLLDNRITFNEKLSIGEDFVFNFLCFSITSNISYLNTAFYLYRDNPASATNSFSEEFFFNHLAPILEIKKLFPNKYDAVLNREIIAIFFSSWSRCYMNPQNPSPLITRVKNIIQIINNEHFQASISNYTNTNMNIFIRIELFLFKKKITFPIWIHAIKANISNTFHNLHSHV